MGGGKSTHQTVEESAAVAVRRGANKKKCLAEACLPSNPRPPDTRIPWQPAQASANRGGLKYADRGDWSRGTENGACTSVIVRSNSGDSGVLDAMDPAEPTGVSRAIAARGTAGGVGARSVTSLWTHTAASVRGRVLRKSLERKPEVRSKGGSEVRSPKGPEGSSVADRWSSRLGQSNSGPTSSRKQGPKAPKQSSLERPFRAASPTDPAQSDAREVSRMMDRSAVAHGGREFAKSCPNDSTM